MGCLSDGDMLAFVEGTLPPDLRSSIDLHLDGCETCLAAVAAVVHVSGTTPNADADLGTPQLLADGSARYILDREIARGGMGRIVAAHDRLLDRRVALKLLRVRDSELARRFLRERLITARLQHPAIVPIYDAGTLEGGEPFFAMRMVSGKTLDRAAAEAKAFEERLRLLPSVIGVVDAVAYAHGEGVIHRDLKPQNVLVGEFGEVVVLDWGIARERDDRSAGSSVIPTAEDTPLTTKAGEVLGTLAYMAPEQAAGAPVDARTDVYGLGAILYEVLVGEPPHLDRAEPAMPPPAERIAKLPDLPSELVAIVQRAMAQDPAARYATARELSEDLKRWQAGRMVKAHEYTPAQLVRRWFRKHRTKLAVAGAAGAVAVVLGSVGVWRVVVERRIAESERDRAQAARLEAETQRTAAESLVQFVLGDLQSRLQRVGRLDVLDGVARAVLSYQDHAPPSDDADTLVRRAVSANLVGEVAIGSGDFVGAEAAHTRALRAAEAAVARKPSADADTERCRAHVGIGDARRSRSHLAEAREAYAACSTLAKGKTEPHLVDFFLYGRIGEARTYRLTGDLLTARKILDELLPMSLALVEKHGAGSEFGSTLGALRNDRWQLFGLIGDIAAQAKEAHALVEHAVARSAVRPDDINARRDVAVAHLAVGLAEENVGNIAAARIAYLDGLAGAREIAGHDPANAEWQRDVAVATDHLGKLALASGDYKSALEWLLESDSISQRVSSLEPNNRDWQRDLGASASTIGDVQLALGKLAEARISMQRAIDVFGRLAREAGDYGGEHDLAIVVGHLGALEIAAGNREAAITTLRRSSEMLAKIFAATDTPQARHELAANLLILAQVEKGEAGRRGIDKAMELIAPLRATAVKGSELDQLIIEADRLAATMAR